MSHAQITGSTWTGGGRNGWVEKDGGYVPHPKPGAGSQTFQGKTGRGRIWKSVRVWNKVGSRQRQHGKAVRATPRNSRTPLPCAVLEPHYTNWDSPRHTPRVYARNSTTTYPCRHSQLRGAEPLSFDWRFTVGRATK